MANLVPLDRCSKQPATGYCFNPECRDKSTDSRHEFPITGDSVRCDKCGSDSPLMVGLLVLIHLLVLDRDGPIVGSQGLRYRFVCDPKRSHLATTTNLEAATGDPTVANCPGCLKALRDSDMIVEGLRSDSDRPYVPGVSKLDPKDDYPGVLDPLY